jgi:peptidoglycan/LPS O-acetylase OafA/YrhL
MDGPTAASGASACVDTVEKLFKNPLAFAKLSLSSGKSLPYDAGKFVMCMNNKNTRYFLVKMAGVLAGQPIPMEMGFCVPDLCDNAGMIDLVKSDTVKKFLPELALVTVTNITATSPQLDVKQPGVGGIIAAVVVGLLVLLVLASSALVLAKQSQSRELPRHMPSGQQLLETPQQSSRPRLPLVIEAFSLFGNSGTLKKLVEIPSYKPTDSLNGLRVLSMAWIILGHTFLMPQGISGYQNEEDIAVSPLNTDTAERNILFSFILSAQSGVDTFFFLSGFLLSYLTLKELRQGRMRVLAAIILRYVRLTPSLALVMLVYYKLWVFFGNGPFAPRFQDSINSRCDASWWSELTYSMNFLPFDSNKVCMGWTWYLGDDMIFFITAMMILPLYHKSRLLGWVSVIALTGLSLGVTTWLVVKYKLSVYVFDKHYQDYSYWAYSKPYTRIPAYFVGLVAAWLLDDMERRGITREARPSSALAKISAKVVAAICGAVLVFLTFITWTDFGDHKNSWGPGDGNKNIWSVLYIDLARPVWATCFAVLTLLCYYDYLPIVNGFLSHSFWTPLARLTYGAYLVHPLVIKLAAARSVQYYTFGTLDMVYRLTGNSMMAYSGSVLLWCLVERPCMTIFSPARKPRSSGTKAPSVSGSDVSTATGATSTANNSSPDVFRDLGLGSSEKSGLKASLSKGSISNEC